MLSDNERRVVDLIDEGRVDLVEYTQELVRFKTITPPDDGRADGDDYRALQAMVGETLGDLGFELETWEADAAELERFPGSGVKPDRDLSNMPILVGSRQGSGGSRSLILNGHYDVVPPGIVENWRHDPFGGEIEDGKIVGRGACDMKGGIAAMLQAVRCIQDAGIELAGDLVVQTVPDEESTCMGTLSCCQRGYRADAALIPEPTDLKVLVAMRGSLYGTITVLGRAGHAEMTQPHWSEGGAVNAISKAVKVIQALEELADDWRTRPDKQHKHLDPDTIIPTVIKGGEWEVTYPEQVEISFGSMFSPSTRGAREEIEAQLMRVATLDPWLRKHPPRLEAKEWWYGAEVDEEEPIVQVGLGALRDLGLEPGLIGYGSLTDAIHLINYAGIPTISIGPGRQSAHMADEYVEIEELVDTAKALAMVILRWCDVQGGRGAGRRGLGVVRAGGE
jgi:acetylornithine deacetylase